jgi:hypothetical protein
MRRARTPMWTGLIVLLLAACSSAGGAAQPKSAASGSGSVASVGPAGSAQQASPAASAIPPRPRVRLSRFHAADGTVITLARFSGPVSFRLHCGSVDPGSAALSVVRAGPRVRASEQHRLVGAFNGGFELSAGVGGYEQEGHVIAPLRRGLASLVIDRSGHAEIGAWGHGVPSPGAAVYSVRQNLRLLVRGGHPSRSAANWTIWGTTLGGGEYVARSALGQTAAGDLVYAGSMSTTPADLAAALVSAGAKAGMELDINPEWVQLDVASRPGGHLRAAIPGQHRPADQYLIGWTRDFITVRA